MSPALIRHAHRGAAPRCAHAILASGALIGLAAGVGAGAAQEPAAQPLTEPLIEYSVDIGSDVELSDPFMDGDEVLDPGDAYPWMGGPYPAPLNGNIDDFVLLGTGIDEPPDPFGAGSAAPTCSGMAPTYVIPMYFDLDGLDCLDFPLEQWLPPFEPAFEPIQEFPTNCVYPADFLTFSYDDDDATHYAPVICSVPVASPSPGMALIYGQTPPKDEIIGSALFGPIPRMWSPPIGIANEDELDPALAPNPDAGDPDDDDTDALDAIPLFLPDGTELGLLGCPFVYFSADHEAFSSLFLNPGNIYVSPPGGGPPLLAVDHLVHLGLPPGVDIDAFEFVFLREQIESVFFLALVFSVDDDDPATPPDESGGLDPNMLYYSFFNGFSSPYLMQRLDDDVDALTFYPEEIPPVVTLGACCFGCSGPNAPFVCLDLDAATCAALNGSFAAGTTCATIPFPCNNKCIGDIDGDGSTLLSDFGVFSANFGLAVPFGTGGDLDCDGFVLLSDFGIFSADFGCVGTP